MKKILLLTAACSIAFFSCKKNDNNTPSRSELLVGTWNVNAYGVDSNNNGLLETSEYGVVPAGAAIIQTYRADGTGVFTGKQAGKADTSYNITWRLTNGNQNLEITSAGVVSNSTISELTDRRLQGYVANANPRVVFLLLK